MNKILVFVPGGVGGAERMSINIAKMLIDSGLQVKVVVIGRMTRIFNLIPETTPIIRIPFHNKYCFSLVRMWWTIMRENPSVVFSSVAAFNPRVIVAAKLAGKNVVIRSSGMVGSYGTWQFFKSRYTYPLADKLIAQQEDMRQEMSRLMNIPLEKIVTLHNPIDTNNIDRLKEEPSPFMNDGSINYVNVAHVNWRKGHDTLIKAFGKVRTMEPKAHLWFVGTYRSDDDYYQMLIALCKSHGLDDYVHFVGYDKNPFRWVYHADCFVFPSRFEGLPNALVEASYIGCPCVATTCLNVVNEIIKDGYNGYTVNVDDIETMADAMLKATKLQRCEMIYKQASQDDFVQVFNEI